MSKDMEEVLYTFFALISPGKNKLWESRVPEKESLEQGRLSFREEVAEHLKKLDMLGSMGPDGVHSHVLGKLVSVFHRSLLKYTKDKGVTGDSHHVTCSDSSWTQ